MMRRLLFAALAALTLPICSAAPTFAQTAPSAPRPARLVSSLPTTEKVIAVTFDDGPSRKYTPMVLDILKQNGAHATFFVIGKEVLRFPELTARAAKEGHEIANHGMNHVVLKNKPTQTVADEVIQGSETIRAATGKKPTLYRLPQGKQDETAMLELGKQGYTVIGWSIDTRDYQRRAADRIATTILSQARPGAIIILHDGGGRRQGTVDALRKVLPELKAKGYRVVSVGEMLKRQGPQKSRMPSFGSAS